MHQQSVNADCCDKQGNMQRFKVLSDCCYERRDFLKVGNNEKHNRNGAQDHVDMRDMFMKDEIKNEQQNRGDSIKEKIRSH